MILTGEIMECTCRIFEDLEDMMGLFTNAKKTFL